MEKEPYSVYGSLLTISLFKCMTERVTSKALPVTADGSSPLGCWVMLATR
ncbi:hypothetical protein AN391_03275 [Pseudoalteromonas sp. P1-13-1a]|nr:hypothetical protein AN391_03275 [Pseudoalteromonas sp. P1-13-1a]